MKPKLYIKPGCPWCNDAIKFFERQAVEVERCDVLKDADHRQRMQEISGQSLTPTFEYENFMVADFSVEEFIAAVKKEPIIEQQLGLKLP
jgi:glutaredoxin 3